MAKHRDIGDYSYVWKLKSEEVEEDIRKAREMVEAIRGYLNLNRSEE